MPAPTSTGGAADAAKDAASPSAGSFLAVGFSTDDAALAPGLAATGARGRRRAALGLHRTGIAAKQHCAPGADSLAASRPNEKRRPRGRRFGYRSVSRHSPATASTSSLELFSPVEMTPTSGSATMPLIQSMAFWPSTASTAATLMVPSSSMSILVPLWWGAQRLTSAPPGRGLMISSWLNPNSSGHADGAAMRGAATPDELSRTTP